MSVKGLDVNIIKLSGLAFITFAICQSPQPSAQNAVRQAEAEVRFHSNSAEAYYRLAVAHIESRQDEACEKALEALAQATRIEPDYAEAYCKMGEIYYKCRVLQGMSIDAEKEVEAFNKALSLRPNYAQAYIGLGNSYIRFTNSVIDQESLILAAEYFKHAVAISPQLLEAYSGLERVYVLQRRNKEAIEIVKQMILLRPDDPWTYRDLTDFCVRLRECDTVISVYHELQQRLGDNAELDIGLGNSYFQVHKYQEATDAFGHAILLRSDDALAHYYLGLVYISLGNKERARGEYNILEKLSKTARQPSDHELYEERARELLFSIDH